MIRLPDTGVPETPPASPESAAIAVSPDVPTFRLEFALNPEDVPLFARLPGLVRAGPSRPATLLWFDDGEGSLAAQGLGLVRDAGIWRLERLEPGDGVDWPACAPCPILSVAATQGALSPSPPLDTAPVAAFEGRHRFYRAGAADIAVLHGTLRGVVDSRNAGRVTVSGRPEALAEALATLAALRLSIPRATLGREAVAVARGAALPARHIGAPALDADDRVGDGLAAILSHLLDALLFWVDIFRRTQPPEAIHQARVATRRLRSALSIYRRVAGCEALEACGEAVKHCAAMLGAARDWDVFLAGAGADLGAAMPDDRRVAALLRAAARRRSITYAELDAYFAGPAFRRLEVSLGAACVLRPWDGAGDPAALAGPTAPFAAGVLARRMKQVRRAGAGLRTLPIEALHELRKDCKRLRYAAEFFAPSFPPKLTKPYLRRLSAVQEDLGALNDAAAAEGLMQQLGRAGSGYAGGVVEGFAAAAALPARAHVAESWKRFKTVDPFWES